MEMSVYYCGLNIFRSDSAGDVLIEGTCPGTGVAVATPAKLRFNRLQTNVPSSTSNQAGSQAPDSLRQRSSAEFNIAFAWKTAYFIFERQLLVAGEDSAAVRSYTATAVKDAAATWSDVVVVTADDNIVGISDSGIKKSAPGEWAIGGKCAVRKLAAGEATILVLTDSGEVLTTVLEGSLSFRRLNLSSRVKSVDCGKEHAMLLTQLGGVLTYGSGSRGQLGHGSIENEASARLVEALDGLAVLAISAGGWHSAAVSDIGDVYVWGWNESGQLGLPCRKLELQRAAPEAAAASENVVTVLALPQVLFAENDDLNFVDVGCGSRHTVALTDDHRLFAWGWNDYGQLGTGDLTSTDSPRHVQYFVDRKSVLPVRVKCGYWSTVIVCAHEALPDQ